MDLDLTITFPSTIPNHLEIFLPQVRGAVNLTNHKVTYAGFESSTRDFCLVQAHLLTLPNFHQGFYFSSSSLHPNNDSTRPLITRTNSTLTGSPPKSGKGKHQLSQFPLLGTATREYEFLDCGVPNPPILSPPIYAVVPTKWRA